MYVSENASGQRSPGAVNVSCHRITRDLPDAEERGPSGLPSHEPCASMHYPRGVASLAWWQLVVFDSVLRDHRQRLINVSL